MLAFVTSGSEEEPDLRANTPLREHRKCACFDRQVSKLIFFRIPDIADGPKAHPYGGDTSFGGDHDAGSKVLAVGVTPCGYPGRPMTETTTIKRQTNRIEPRISKRRRNTMPKGQDV